MPRTIVVGLLVGLALGVLWLSRAAVAQQATTVSRIGRLSPGSPRLVAPLWEIFRQGLRDLGYVEGQNLVIEDRYAEGSEERLRDLAAELVQLPVDVIVAEGGAARTARASIITSPTG